MHIIFNCIFVRNSHSYSNWSVQCSLKKIPIFKKKLQNKCLNCVLIVTINQKILKLVFFLLRDWLKPNISIRSNWKWHWSVLNLLGQILFHFLACMIEIFSRHQHFCAFFQRRRCFSFFFSRHLTAITYYKLMWINSMKTRHTHTHLYAYV